MHAERRLQANHAQLGAKAAVIELRHDGLVVYSGLPRAALLFFPSFIYSALPRLKLDRFDRVSAIPNPIRTMLLIAGPGVFDLMSAAD